MKRTILALLLAGFAVWGQTQIVWTDREKPIAEQIRVLRSVPDSTRGAATKKLALEIRQLPDSSNKLTLASGLANLSTEGDFGKDVLQEVAVTLAGTLSAREAQSQSGMPGEPYVTLAQLIRYEGVRVAMSGPLLNAAMARLELEEQRRQKADFTLSDLHGHTWTLSALRGKVVLVNFWATWCPPCRKEMPDLERLSQEFAARGLVILAISDEDAAKVQPFIASKNISYPILLDPGDKVNKLMAVEGIPKSFVYDRSGKLVAQAIDMRTRGQFLEMLKRAGLQ